MTQAADIDITQLAERVGRSAGTLRRLERAGRIPSARRDPLTNRRLWTEQQAQEVQQILLPRAMPQELDRRARVESAESTGNGDENKEGTE